MLLLAGLLGGGDGSALACCGAGGAALAVLVAAGCGSDFGRAADAVCVAFAAAAGFDFGGVYDAVTNNEYIEYTLGDGRKVKVSFDAQGSKTNVTESFEAESMNSVEMQKGGWQAILDNFKKYTEAN